jgi:hypothetical protein
MRDILQAKLQMQMFNRGGDAILFVAGGNHHRQKFQLRTARVRGRTFHQAFDISDQCDVIQPILQSPQMNSIAGWKDLLPLGRGGEGIKEQPECIIDLHSVMRMM